MSLVDELKYKFHTGNFTVKLIFINVTVFILISIFKLVAFLSAGSFNIANVVIENLAVPSSIPHLITKPWTLLTYMFLHEQFFHILFNMVTLSFVGTLFEEMFGKQRMLATYLLSGLFGALLYILAYNLFPAFSSTFAINMGASASIMGLLVAFAVYLPDYTVHLMLIGPIKFKWLALIFIVIDFISIPGGNAGGHIAHIGGALWGLIYMLQFKAGTDMASWLMKLQLGIEGLFTKKRKMKVVHRQPQSAKESQGYRKNENQQELIDKILDKISKSGYESLSKDEKDILFKASKEKS
jgi:membrane associated rhomboid family serine protease